MTTGDINKDGLEDVYVGGGNGKAGELFLQQKNKSFTRKSIAAFEADKLYQDAEAVFLDANGDGYLDAVLGNYAGGVSYFKGVNASCRSQRSNPRAIRAPRSCPRVFR